MQEKKLLDGNYNIERQNKGVCHPHDWKIDYTDVDENNFGINIYECRFQKYAKLVCRKM